MSRRDRIDRLEVDLSPVEAVGSWLADAHGFGSSATYLAWLIDQPAAMNPFIRIADQVRADTTRRFQGQPKAAMVAAVKNAVRDAIFRVALVFELNDAASTDLRVRRLERMVLLQTAQFLDPEGTRAPGPPAGDSLFDQDHLDEARRHLPGAVAAHLVQLLAIVEARRELERTWLGGQMALFPDPAAEQDQLIAEGDLLDEYVEGMGTGPPIRTRPGASSDVQAELRRAARMAAARARSPHEAAARLTGARIMAFNVLGDHEMAATLARSSLRRMTMG